MSARVNLLLLISAMLSALTGVGGTTRVREAPAVAARVVATVAQVAQAPERTHPQPQVPALAALPDMALTVLALVPAEPIYASRRRE